MLEKSPTPSLLDRVLRQDGRGGRKLPSADDEGRFLAYSADVQQRPSSTPFAERERDRTDLRTAPVE